MENFYELLEKLNGLKLIQTSIDWTECLPDEIWNEHFNDNFEHLKGGLEIDRHRWYETSTSVIKIYDKLLGVRHISNLFSEDSSCEDCCFTLLFFEMQEFTTISYRQIK